MLNLYNDLLKLLQRKLLRLLCLLIVLLTKWLNRCSKTRLFFNGEGNNDEQSKLKQIGLHGFVNGKQKNFPANSKTIMSWIH